MNEDGSLSLACKRCGKVRVYSKYDVERGRPTEHCRACALSVRVGRLTVRTPEEIAAQKADWYQRNKAKQDLRIRQWRQMDRLGCIKLLGGACVHCGETDPIVLDFDHPDDDGAVCRKQSKYVLSKVKRNPERFQLLCKNCNWRKEYWRRQRNAKQNP